VNPVVEEAPVETVVLSKPSSFGEPAKEAATELFIEEAAADPLAKEARGVSSCSLLNLQGTEPSGREAAAAALNHLLKRPLLLNQ
jgi:hypothetical protein